MVSVRSLLRNGIKRPKILTRRRPTNDDENFEFPQRAAEPRKRRPKAGRILDSVPLMDAACAEGGSSSLQQHEVDINPAAPAAALADALDGELAAELDRGGEEIKQQQREGRLQAEHDAQDEHDAAAATGPSGHPISSVETLEHNSPGPKADLSPTTAPAASSATTVSDSKETSSSSKETSFQPLTLDFGFGQLIFEQLPELAMPRLVIRLVKKPWDNAKTRTLLEGVSTVLSRATPFTLLFDVRTCCLPSRSQIGVAREWIRTHYDTIQEQLQGIAILLTSVMVRSTVNMLLSMAKPAQPNGVFAKEADALHFARDRCAVVRVWSAAVGSAAAASVGASKSAAAASAAATEAAHAKNRTPGQTTSTRRAGTPPSSRGAPSSAAPSEAVLASNGTPFTSNSGSSARTPAGTGRAQKSSEFSAVLIGSEMSAVSFDAPAASSSGATSASAADATLARTTADGGPVELLADDALPSEPRIVKAAVHVSLQPWGARRPVILSSLASRLSPRRVASSVRRAPRAAALRTERALNLRETRGVSPLLDDDEQPRTGCCGRLWTRWLPCGGGGGALQDELQHGCCDSEEVPPSVRRPGSSRRKSREQLAARDGL